MDLRLNFNKAGAELCESDTLGAVTMLLAAKLSGKAVFFGDPLKTSSSRRVGRAQTLTTRKAQTLTMRKVGTGMTTI